HRSGGLMRSQGSGHGRKPANQDQNHDYSLLLWQDRDGHYDGCRSHRGSPRALNPPALCFGSIPHGRLIQKGVFTIMLIATACVVGSTASFARGGAVHWLHTEALGMELVVASWPTCHWGTL